MKNELAKIAIVILASIALGWILMAVGTWLLWQVDWRLALGVWLLTIGYAIEQGATKTLKKWKL